MKILKTIFAALPIIACSTSPLISLSSCGNKVNITLSKANMSLNVGQIYPLYAIANFENSSTNIKWASSDNSIATVSKGMVKAIKKGNCTITASFSEGQATCIVSVNDADEFDKSVCLTNESDDKIAILSFTKDVTKPANLQYYDESSSSWIEVTQNYIEIAPKTKLMLRGNNYNGFNVKKDDGQWSQNQIVVKTSGESSLNSIEQAEITLSGSILGLIDNGGTVSLEDWEMKEYCFAYAFRHSSAIKNVSDNFLSNEKLLDLSANCYESMFDGCTSLTNAPELPAGWIWGGNLASHCYSNMFDSCYYLTKPPILPAIELKESCYESMFSLCTELDIYENNTNYKLFFTCPKDIPNNATKNMFYECFGEHPVDAVATNNYYYKV